jgi:putative inorganic carbon (HCO3(-)) transporter
MLAVLAWAPIPIGSARGWSLAILEAGILFLMAAWAVSFAYRPFKLPDAVLNARTPLAILSIWCAFPLIQLIPVSTGIAEFFGGELHTLYGDVPTGMVTDATYLTLDRGATLSGFIEQCSGVALLFLVLAFTTTASRLRTLLVVMVFVGFIEAIYGLLVYFTGDELGLWNPGHAQVTISGTYVNQNHYAGLLEMAIPAGMGLYMSLRREDEGLSGARGIARVLSTLLLTHRGVILFCILMMAAALILTNSRGGIGALAIGVAVAIVIAVLKKGVRAAELRLGMLVVAIAVIAVIWLGSGQIYERLHSTGFTSQRGELRELSYEMIGDNPVVGTGVRTYRWVLPSYKDSRLGSYFYDHAHNDFLEILSEQGFLGFLLFFSGLSLISLALVGDFWKRREPLARGALFAAVAGCTSLMIHGLVDFNLQIPANMSYFFALLGCGLVAGCLRRNVESSSAMKVRLSAA